MDWLIPRAAYIHVPFCAHHCGYCDFAVSTDQERLAELYLDALATEMKGEPASIDTVFIGGGTPTQLSLPQLGRLMAIIRERFPNPIAEFSIESTPDSITADKVALLADHGVTRISIGIQSFDARTLKALDRQHGVGQIHAALASVRTAKLEFSLDMIFGAPGQTLESWQHDLDTALRFEPHHLSTYGLTYEKGTPLWKRRWRGEVNAVGEDTELAMYETAIDTLTSAGYEHYEVSNYSKPGHRCRHNDYYWANHAYHGFGVGAARYVNGERSHNVRGTKVYIQRILAGEDATLNRETLLPRERAFETLAVQLRRCDGIDRDQFASQTGFDITKLAGPAIDALVTIGLLRQTDGRIHLTRRGLCLADAVIEKLMSS